MSTIIAGAAMSQRGRGALGNYGEGLKSEFGLGGGAEEAAQYNMDPAAYQEFYNQAVEEIKNAGADEASQANRKSIQNILSGQLGDLENNAAGRKQNFMEDMSRGFQADQQSMARAKGGTGTLAQAMRMPGSAYDSQARATSRGLNDLYSQATDDLGQLQGVQGNLYSQDMGKATSLANLYTGELNSRRGTTSQNLDNQWNAQQAMYERGAKSREKAAKAVMSMYGGGMGGGGGGG